MMEVGFQGQGEKEFNWAWYYSGGNQPARKGKRERDTKKDDAGRQWTTGLYRYVQVRQSGVR